MSVHYDFYSNPIPPNSNRKPRLHARVVSRGTVSTQELAKYIHDCSSLSTADVKGVLTALCEALSHYLRYGQKVHLEGLGSFELTLTCPPVRYPHEIRAESIHFKSVVFRPDRELKNEFRTLHLERAKEKRHSKKLSPEEVDQRLQRYFATHETITRESFQSLCGFIRCTACRRLQQLVKDGKLQKTGPKSYPSYQPANNYYQTE
ncbi:HU family DNA-binding protein [Parabacteroides sp. PF5-6]|uniref:HU family DNA-binding protein n=1 Tax=Parabacteroides sp. PF5-6 TaxID=1742403 RepID=UPI0024072534|nr:HU family DNA-binding protein [Parabacteroides sp. PF5-6]MDF9829184.1 putative histone-like DNA-binding protein [Parabacteroides sp. PF5-6]